MNGLDQIDRDGPMVERQVARVVEQWLDSHGYDLDRISIEQEIEYLLDMKKQLRQAGFPMDDLPGGGRLLVSHRINQMSELAWKRWRGQSCDTMLYPFAEYVQQGMVWPVETRQDRPGMVKRVQQIEEFIQSLDGMRKSCKDQEHDAGVMYIKSLDTSDSRMYLVIRLATPINRMNDAIFSRMNDPEAPYTCCGIKFMHNLYERPPRGNNTRRPGFYNIAGLPTRLLHHNPSGWDQISVLEAIPGQQSAEFHNTGAQDIINNIKQMHDWMQEHVRGTDRVVDFDF